MESNTLTIQQTKRLSILPTLYRILVAMIIISFFLSICASCKAPTKRQLPPKLVVGYGYWGQCDDKVIEIISHGVNVMIWFSIDLVSDKFTGKAKIERGPDYACVAKIVQKLKEKKLDTIHLISIGGWDAYHPNITHTGKEYYDAWITWNRAISRPDMGFEGFDGFDWDLEGNDDIKSEYNFFQLKVFTIMGEMSQLAKNDGYLISMAPAESYTDPTTDLFDRNLTHNYPEWENIVPHFTYHGHNPYTYLIAKYGNKLFDFISVQIYEGYSHALFNVTILNQPFSEYLVNLVEMLYNGWMVDFSNDSEIDLMSQVVKINPDQLVIGLANGWADSHKFLLAGIDEIKKGYNTLLEKKLDIRGFMFWDIEDEGRVPQDQKEAYWLAKALNDIFRIRKGKNI